MIVWHLVDMSHILIFCWCPLVSWSHSYPFKLNRYGNLYAQRSHGDPFAACFHLRNCLPFGG